MLVIRKLSIIPNYLAKLKPWNSWSKYRNKDFLNIIGFRKAYCTKKKNDQSGKHDLHKKSRLVDPRTSTKPNCPKKLCRNLNDMVHRKTNENKDTNLVIDKRNCSKYSRSPVKQKCIQKDVPAKVEKLETKIDEEVKARFSTEDAVHCEKNKFRAVPARKPNFQAIAPKRKFKAVSPKKTDKSKIEDSASTKNRENKKCVDSSSSPKSLALKDKRKCKSHKSEKVALPTKTNTSKCKSANNTEKAKSATIDTKGKSEAVSKTTKTTCEGTKPVEQKTATGDMKPNSKNSKVHRSKSAPNIKSNKPNQAKSTKVKKCKSSQSLQSLKNTGTSNRKAKKCIKGASGKKSSFPSQDAKTASTVPCKKPDLSTQSTEPKSADLKKSTSKCNNQETTLSERPKDTKPKETLANSENQKCTSTAQTKASKTSICNKKKPVEVTKSTKSCESVSSAKPKDTEAKATLANSENQKCTSTAQTKASKTSICNKKKPVEVTKSTKSCESVSSAKPKDTEAKTTLANSENQKCTSTAQTKASKTSICNKKKPMEATKSTKSCESVSSVKPKDTEAKATLSKSEHQKSTPTAQAKASKTSICSKKNPVGAAKSIKSCESVSSVKPKDTEPKATLPKSEHQKSTPTAQAKASKTSICSKKNPVGAAKSMKYCESVSSVKPKDTEPKATLIKSKCQESAKNSAAKCTKPEESTSSKESSDTDPKPSLPKSECQKFTQTAKSTSNEKSVDSSFVTWKSEKSSTAAQALSSKASICGKEETNDVLQSKESPECSKSKLIASSIQRKCQATGVARAKTPSSSIANSTNFVCGSKSTEYANAKISDIIPTYDKTRTTPQTELTKSSEPKLRSSASSVELKSQTTVAAAMKSPSSSIVTKGNPMDASKIQEAADAEAKTSDKNISNIIPPHEKTQAAPQTKATKPPATKAQSPSTTNKVKSVEASKSLESAAVKTTKESTVQPANEKTQIVSQAESTKPSVCNENRFAASTQADASSSMFNKTRPANASKCTQSATSDQVKSSKSEPILRNVNSEKSLSSSNKSDEPKNCLTKTSSTKSHKSTENTAEMDLKAETKSTPEQKTEKFIKQPTTDAYCGRHGVVRFEPNSAKAKTPSADGVKSKPAKSCKTKYDFKIPGPSSSINCGRYIRADQVKPIKGAKATQQKANNLTAPELSVTKCAKPAPELSVTKCAKPQPLKSEISKHQAEKKEVVKAGTAPVCKKRTPKSVGFNSKKSYSSKANTYRNISLATILAVMGFCGFTFMSIENKDRPKFVPYEYLYRRSKRFPWGDGTKSYFHNSEVNALPTGYEEIQENEANVD